MPCTSQWGRSPEQIEESNKYQRLREIEEINNTALLLRAVQQILGHNKDPRVEEIKRSENPTKEDADWVTSTLCGILTNITEEEKQKIRENEYNLYIQAWWGEHKAWDKLKK